MPKAVSATEAKNRLGALMRWALDRCDAVIVENHGEPRVVILPFDQYVKLQSLEEERRRQEALATMRRLQADVSACNQDLSEEEIEALADRATRDAIDSLMRQGKVRFAE